MPQTVLIAEDDDDLLAVVQMALEAEGFEVVTASNGREALRRIEGHMPDVILLDMKMPVMNGWEFATEFHQRFDEQARVVVMTAAEHASLRAREIGASGWLSKPFGMRELIATVKAQAAV